MFNAKAAFATLLSLLTLGALIVGVALTLVGVIDSNLHTFAIGTASLIIGCSFAAGLANGENQ